MPSNARIVPATQLPQIERTFLDQSSLLPNDVKPAERSADKQTRSPSPFPHGANNATHHNSAGIMRAAGSKFAAAINGLAAAATMNQASAAAPSTVDVALWQGDAVSSNAVGTIRDARLKSNDNKKYDMMPGDAEARDTAFAADHYLDPKASFVKLSEEKGLSALVQAVRTAEMNHTASTHFRKRMARMFSAAAANSPLKTPEQHAADMERLNKEQRRFTTLRENLEKFQAGTPMYQAEFLEKRRLFAEWFASLAQ